LLEKIAQTLITKETIEKEEFEKLIGGPAVAKAMTGKAKKALPSLKIKMKEVK